MTVIAEITGAVSIVRCSAANRLSVTFRLPISIDWSIGNSVNYILVAEH